MSSPTEKESAAPKDAAAAETALPASATQPNADAFEEIGSLLQEGFKELRGSMRRVGIRTAKETHFSTLEDFRRADPTLKRVVAIGCTGSGKSTLLNFMAGWRLVQKPPDYEFEWQPKLSADARPDGSINLEAEAETNAEEKEESEEEEEMAAGKPPLFESGDGSDSVTKRTSYANIDWFGDAAKPFIAVDTPGYDDPAGADIDSAEARDVLGQLAADLHNKLKALNYVNVILVLHNDVTSNRLNPATYTILKMVDEKFAKSGHSVWEHVVVGYSKCNSHETSWRSGLKNKCKAMQKAIRDTIPNCTVDVPVLALGGASIEPPPPSHMSKADAGGFDELWQFIEAAPPLDCAHLQPFEGADVKWQHLIAEKDEAEARAKASMIYMAVVMKLVGLICLLFVRAFCLPRSLAALIACGMLACVVYMVQGAEDRSKIPRTPLFASALAFLMINLYTVFDELALLFLFITYVGPNDLKNSLRHFNDVWVEPRFHLNQYIEKVEPVSKQLLSGVNAALAKAMPAAAAAAKQKTS